MQLINGVPYIVEEASGVQILRRKVKKLSEIKMNKKGSIWICFFIEIVFYKKCDSIIRLNYLNI
jgi:hypothetical protein